MAFRENAHQQLSVFDRVNRLTERERKTLEKSWAKVFADDIFTAIDETRFSVLYSEKASRPNTAVNVIVGALIIKELFGLSDDEVVENLMLDIHFQYALHTTSFAEQPLSDKSLSRFRKRCYAYEATTGIDLFHDCICDLNYKIAKMMKLNPRIKRMDSLMIEANIKNMSRIELLYACAAHLARRIHRDRKEIDLGKLGHYCDSDDRNLVIYHSRDVDVDVRTKTIISEAEQLLTLCDEKLSETQEFQLLTRCLSEQTVIEDGKRRLMRKGKESPSPSSLQNPSDPEATYRKKAGTKHIGYVANVVETVGENGSVITDYQYENNVYSDQHFLRDYLDRSERQERPVQIVADGAYWDQSIRDAAREKNIEIINTALLGVAVPDIYADFVVNDGGDEVLSCPNGCTPARCQHFKSTNQIKAYFSPASCRNCPHAAHCTVKIRSKSGLVVISRTAIERARQQRRMTGDTFQNWRRIRNGVESIPSILRNRFDVDKIPARGKIPSKFYFGTKISAVNFRKLFRFRKGLGWHPYNPIIAGNAN